MSEPPIQHLIVLMLENRSFDHMLGYLKYPPDVPFEGIAGRELQFPNPLPDGDVFAGPNARYIIEPGPDHTHEAVMKQLLNDAPRSAPYRVTNSGFAADYERIAPGNGARALECFPPKKLPILSALAKEFAVCDHWFCSVPGATWPNRNFAHAATSDGEVNISLRQYANRTVFELLEAEGRDWAVYYGGFPAQTMAFTRLWNASRQSWLQRFKPIQRLYRAIRHDRLPHYAFVEPDMLGRTSDSQHPSMGGEMDFRAGERLIWRNYTALRANPLVFAKTLLLITYDEHGGFFDHVPPPQGPEWCVEQGHTDPRTGYSFPFDLLGPRVPAVLVSPWIPRGTVDQTVYDHSSIPATVRRIFGLTGQPLSNRETRTNTFERCLTADVLREDVPVLEEPFVNENARRLAEGVELRGSLAFILRDLLWDQIAERARSWPAQTLARLDPFGPGRAGGEELEQVVDQQVMEVIAPQLSPEAQAVLEQESLANQFPAGLLGADGLPGRGGGSSVDAVIASLKHRVERLLEENELVDDAMHFADLLVRRFFEDRNVILRSPDGLSTASPDDAAIEAAIAAVYAGNTGQECAWLADHRDRWLAVRAGGALSYLDWESDDPLVKERAPKEQALRLFLLLKRNNPGTVRREMEGR